MQQVHPLTGSIWRCLLLWCYVVCGFYGFPLSLIVATESEFHLTENSCSYHQILSGLVLRMGETLSAALAFPTVLESVFLTSWQWPAAGIPMFLLWCRKHRRCLGDWDQLHQQQSWPLLHPLPRAPSWALCPAAPGSQVSGPDSQKN